MPYPARAEGLVNMIKTVPHPPYSPDLAPCDFWLFPNPRGCRYETIKEMKEAVTKVIDTLTQEDFHEAFQKLLERYNKRIPTGGDYFKGDVSFMCILEIKVPIRKKSGNLFYYLRILFCPVSWGWRIHWLHLCRGVRPLPERVSWIWH